ncbi:LysR family transcriptional regulator [Azospirillum doebereinerae]|uniref:LysR family transcriptional regulator n=1 Tax=Azospirillum doebereinerae TaxID=92933 RepID=A0A433J3M1_9PROT|nr:LysR family transcriptional regulator [Azospirillum doebereinerae]RUQ66404.1 LysR family transcriptional regulator [Azospirillum doebereinerae]
MTSGLNLNRLAHFVAVVDTGSFTAAAERLGVTKAVVSQHVARLEQEVRATLLVRTTRRLTPTEAGLAFHRTCTAILQQAEEAVACLSESSVTPSGTVRVTAPFDYGTAILAPAAARLSRLHPGCRAELVLTDHSLDLVAEKLDLAIRIGWLTDSSHRARRIGGFQQLLVAAPELAERAAPRTPHDLAALPWIAQSTLRNPLRLTFTHTDGTTATVEGTAAITANATPAVRACVLAGAGVSVIPDYLIGQDVAEGRLRHLLPGWRLPEGGIHAVFPSARFRSGAVRALLDLLMQTPVSFPGLRDASPTGRPAPPPAEPRLP